MSESSLSQLLPNPPCLGVKHSSRDRMKGPAGISRDGVPKERMPRIHRFRLVLVQFIDGGLIPGGEVRET